MTAITVYGYNFGFGPFRFAFTEAMAERDRKEIWKSFPQNWEAIGHIKPIALDQLPEDAICVTSYYPD